MSHAYDVPLDDGLFWKGWRQTEVSEALGATPNVGFRPVQLSNYIFFKEGGVYYRRKGLDGSVTSHTSCTLLLQEALNALTAGGQIGFMGGCGDYYVNKIVVPSYVTLKGPGWAYAGSNNVRLILNGGVNDNMIENSDPTGASGGNTNINIFNLNLYGNGAGQTAGDIINFANTHHVEIRNCYISNGYDNLVTLATSSQNVIIDRCQLFNSLTGGEAINITGCSDSWITNNLVSSGAAGNHGIYDASGANRITGNEVYLCGDIGIYLSATYNQVVNNIVHDNQNPGIYCYGQGKHVITNNICVNNSQSGANTHSGIHLYNSFRNTVVSNLCLDSAGTHQKYGIFLQGTSDYNTVKANTCYQNVTSPYCVDAGGGAHNTYDGKAQSPEFLDLSAAGGTIRVLTFNEAAHLTRATVLAVNENVGTANNVSVGKANAAAADVDYYALAQTSGTPNEWGTTVLTLTATCDITSGDTVTFTCAGGSGDAGEVVLIIDYLTGCTL